MARRIDAVGIEVWRERIGAVQCVRRGRMRRQCRGPILRSRR
jgi:hypothetical protein